VGNSRLRSASSQVFPRFPFTPFSVFREPFFSPFGSGGCPDIPDCSVFVLFVPGSFRNLGTSTLSLRQRLAAVGAVFLWVPVLAVPFVNIDPCLGRHVPCKPFVSNGGYPILTVRHSRFVGSILRRACCILVFRDKTGLHLPLLFSPAGCFSVC